MLRLMNLWPPLLGAGIRVVRMDAELREVDVEMKMRRWNRNYVGAHFGGSLFAMTDPFYMMMLMENLGPGFVVWDKAASIRFRRPGRGHVRAEFRLSAERVEEIREAIARDGRGGCAVRGGGEGRGRRGGGGGGAGALLRDQGGVRGEGEGAGGPDRVDG